MYKTISEFEFYNAFDLVGRGEQFSPQGLTALWEYLKDLEISTGDEIELDVIGLCCSYTEYDSATEAAKDYGFEPDEENEEEEFVEKDALAWLDEYTVTIPFDGGVIIHVF